MVAVLEKNINYFEVPSLDAQDALLKERSTPVDSFVDEKQAFPAASEVANDAVDDDDYDSGGVSDWIT